MWNRDEGEVEARQIAQDPRLPSRDPLSDALNRMKNLERDELAKIIGPAIRTPTNAQIA